MKKTKTTKRNSSYRWCAINSNTRQIFHDRWYTSLDKLLVALPKDSSLYWIVKDMYHVITEEP